MRRRWRVVVGTGGLLLVASTLAVGCGAGGVRSSEAPTGSIATLSLRSAAVAAAATDPARRSTLSCRGGALCREMKLPDAPPERIGEATEDCARRGGETRREPCARAGVVASCVLEGADVPISVFTYAQADASAQQDVVSTMREACETLDGTFALAPRAEAPATAAGAPPCALPALTRTAHVTFSR